jgi:glutamate racemase
MQIVDSAESTARVVKKIIEEDVICHPERSEGASATERSRRTPIAATMSPAEHRTFRFYVTDSTDKFKRLATRFLGRQVDHVEHVDLGG